ncbi:glycosyl transferase family 1 [Phenylobacterium deserti]|uniref:Glycosyl transferase family 1 n=1 Tax=Phenylobacterium deserti TaxID=1914756 RepID=A0A328AZS2_9CAUL|nr:glycosyl transferase family 1 [Phenylobacterium deserti]
MPNRFSVYAPGGRVALPNNPFGKDVANHQLFRSLALHGGYEQFDVLSLRPSTDEVLRTDLVGDGASPTRFMARAVTDQAVPAASGVLLRGAADILELSWLRRRMVGDTAYSLMGLVHTLGPPAIRQTIANALHGPTHAWDAIICTSPSVQQAVRQMMDEYGDWLAERTGGSAPQGPSLPIVPLGVDGARFAGLADRPQVRQAVRQRLGVADDGVLLLWVGRLSYFEKAFPQPMFRAAQQAAEATGAKVTFALAGWFPSENDRGIYQEAAAAQAPGVDIRFLDGNDHGLVGELWAASDVFISLVDNVQETFGITPIEAMAAGLPVVVSDWDGYRFTVRDGQEGFLIPTLSGPINGVGEFMAGRHVIEMDAYQAYVGAVAQHTAVNVAACADALARLIREPELRRRMGAAGRERVRTAFDWPVVVGQINALADELAQVRQAAQKPVTQHRLNPIKGDPFRDFAGFATDTWSLDLRLSARPGVTVEQVRGSRAIRLDSAFGQWRGDLEEAAQAFELIAAAKAATPREVLASFPPNRRRLVEMSLAWMAKQGFLEWRQQT